jgi:hypothetical protein
MLAVTGMLDAARTEHFGYWRLLSRDRTPTGRAAVRGVAVGEHLGYLFTGLWSALAGVALVQSNLRHPLFGIVGLLLDPRFVLGSLEFVGPFQPRDWKPAGTLVPLAYIGWSLWQLALGVGLLVTA